MIGAPAELMLVLFAFRRLPAGAVPVSILTSLDRDGGAVQAEACDAYEAGMAGWLRDLASSLPPPPPALDDGDGAAAPRDSWCRILAAETQDVLNLMGVGGSAEASSVPNRAASV